MDLKEALNRWLLSKGRRVTRYPTSHYLRHFDIDCVLDVGANRGQFSQEIREHGYKGRIASFEPLAGAFALLEQAAATDPHWTAYDHAIGATKETLEINVSSNSASSSFLELNPVVSDNFKFLNVESTQAVSVETLDSVFDAVVGESRNVYLKIDTQGFERNVIEGAEKSLERVSVVQMETSLIPHYRGESLIEDMIALMREKGFVPWWIYDGFRNPNTLQCYQCESYFVNDAAT